MRTSKFVSHFLWPSYAQYNTNAFIGKNPQLCNYFLSWFPGFRAVMKHCFNICFVKLYFGRKKGLLRTTYRFQWSKCLSRFENTCFHICVWTSLYISHGTKVREPIYFIYPLTVHLEEASAGLVIRTSRVKILLPATRWICLRWSRINLLHAL